MSSPSVVSGSLRLVDALRHWPSARHLRRKFRVLCDFNVVTASYGRHVPVYVIEAYLGKADREGREARERGSRRAAAELTRSGSTVRFLEFLYVPEDELCLVRFEAARRELVDAVAARAGLEPLRIVRALPIADGTSPT